MPLPREHSARIAPVGRFQKGTFRSHRIAPGIRLIIAKRCATCAMKIQSVRFHVCSYTVSQAKAWLARHKKRPIKFEPATGKCGR